MSTAPARKMRWTEEQYLAFEAGSETKHEYFDGEIYGMAGAKGRHHALCANVIAALHALARRGGACQMFTSDQRIRVEGPTRFYTYADGGVACGTWAISASDGMSVENPVLLVEVLSPSTREYDRGAKLFYYQQIPSLVDVLLLDQPTPHVEHHHRGPKGWRVTRRDEGTISLLGGEIAIAELDDLPPGLPEE